MAEFKPILESIQDIDTKLNQDKQDQTLSDIIGEDFVNFFNRSIKYYQQDNDLEMKDDIKKNRISIIKEILIILVFLFWQIFAFVSSGEIVIFNLIICISLIAILITDIVKYYTCREFVFIDGYFAPCKIEFSLKNKLFRYKKHGHGKYDLIKIIAIDILIILSLINGLYLITLLKNPGIIAFICNLILLFNKSLYLEGVFYNYDTFVMEASDKCLICDEFFRNFRRIDK